MTAASVVADLAMVERDLEASGSLLANFYMPWDADDTRPLCTLKDVLDAQQRALIALARIVGKQQRTTAGLVGRVNSVEVLS